MTAPAPTSPIVRTIAALDVPPAGAHVAINADADLRAALAVAADIPSVESFSAEFELKPWGRDGFALQGRVKAEVTQACVVTLEPVPGRVDETVSIKLVPPEGFARWEEKQDAEGAIDIDLSAEVPEIFENGVIDLGALALEHFLVGLDPYPRKEGAVFDADAAGVGEGRAELSPFAALARRDKE